MALKKGDVIADGAFRVLDVLIGGFSQVIIAQEWSEDEPTTGLTRAIKCIREDQWRSVQNKPSVIKQLKKQALVWQTILRNCPHTAELLMTFPDFFGLGPVVIMEVVDGPSVQALRNKCTRLSVNQNVRIAIEIAEALRYAHAAGVQHRDLTPANVLLTRQNHIKVIDWGLSSVKGSAGQGAYTPGFASPQREVDPSLSDPSDDVFALGVLLHSCLTGKLPIRQKWNKSEIEAALQDGLNIPDSVVEIVAKCLEREPQLRPTAEVVFSELSGSTFCEELRKWERDNAFCRQCNFIGATRDVECPICGEQIWERLAQAPQPGMVRIPAGHFTHGLDTQQIEVALQAVHSSNISQEYREHLVGSGKRKVFLPAFDIDIYPVTNADFLKFCKETRYPAHESLTYKAQTLPDHPVVHVDWKDSLCYALWKGRRLPSSLEWEKSARGQLDDRPYPWGSIWRSGLCNNAYDHSDTKTTPVGRYSEGARDGRSPFGVADMVGNVNEWVNEGTKQGMKAVRGGSWAVSCVLEGLVSNEMPAEVKVEDETIGFRCAADVVYDEVPVKEH